MFPFQSKPERRTSFEEIFFEHYSRLLEWALQLTHRDRPDAEDLVQELYVRFARLDIIPEHIENAESYLFSVLRNLHYARMRRARKSAIDDLSIVDYDSAQYGLRAVDRSGLLFVRSDLHRICDYLCSRKDTSRSASIFILRYFLGYFPNEVMKVAQSTRVAVDKAIQAVRREARLDLKRPGAIRPINSNREQKTRTPNGLDRDRDQNLFLVLRAKIFASCTGTCFGPSVLESKYAQPGQSFATEELAHLVSCTTCLDQANHILGLPLLEERSPDDTIGRDKPQGPDGSAGSAPTLVSGRSSRSKNELERRRLRLKRYAEEVDQHRPQRLLIVVDGDVRASQKVTAPMSELRVELGKTEKPSFIEVLSEQGICLAFVPVQQLVPDGDLYQTQESDLSDDRAIRIVVSFTEETPAIQVIYRDPLIAAEAEDDEARTENRVIATNDTILPTLASFEKPNVHAWPRSGWTRIANIFFLKMNPFLAGAMLFALCSVACFVLWTRSGPRISPRTLLARAEQSDASVLKSPHPGVIYQKVRISAPDHSIERVIYRDPEKKRKLKPQHLDATAQRFKHEMDSAGVDWNDPLSAANYAQWRDRQPVKQDAVKQTGLNLLTLTTSTDADTPVLSESLTVRESDFHPVERTIRLRDQGTVEIAELNYDVLPWGAVNQDLFEPISGEAGVVPGNVHPALSIPLPRVLSDLQLDEAELGARIALHDLQADQGEQIRLTRTAQGIEVKGVVDTDQRKEQIVSQLLTVPHVHPSILSVEEIEDSPPSGSPAETGPVQTYSVDAQPSPLEKYMREKKFPLDELAAISQQLLDGSLRIQQAETHLSELRHHFADADRLPGDLQRQLAALLQNYVSAIQAGLDEDQRALLSLNLGNAASPESSSMLAPDAGDLNAEVRRYQQLCQELIAGGSGQPRPANVIADELMESSAQIHDRISQMQVPAPVAHKDE